METNVAAHQNNTHASTPTAQDPEVITSEPQETHVPNLVKAERRVLRASEILHLQRTVGNAATARLVAGRSKPTIPAAAQNPNHHQADTGTVQRSPNQAGMHVTPLRTGTALQRKVMSFNEFQARIKKISDRDPEVNERALTGEKTIDAITEERTAKGRNVPKRNEMIVDIMEAYKNYQAFRKWSQFEASDDQIIVVKEFREKIGSETYNALEAMIDLYHKITLWITLNERRSWAKNLVPLLQEVMEGIESDVQAEMKKRGANIQGGKGKEKANSSGMPSMIAQAGVPEPWFRENIVNGHVDKLKNLTAFCAKLLDPTADASAAEENYKSLKDIPGMTFIRSIILSSVPERAGLQGIVGTEGTESKPTKEEMDALIYYTSETGVEQMNDHLRAHKVKASPNPSAPARPGSPPTRPAAPADNITPKIRLAVSALNKLPKYQGIAWRVLLNTPRNYLNTIHPGGLVADLGFTSASPSVLGTKYYKEGGAGFMRAVFFMIHAQTAVNVSGYALQPKEGEVLFKPGTRFKVNAIWEYVNGKVPREAPVQVQMLLHREGEEITSSKKLDADEMAAAGGKIYETRTERVKVIEVTEV